MLLDSYDPYKPAVIPWPALAPAARARLAALPFWDVALETEENAGARMQAMADATADPLIKEALTLNAFEERRHKAVLGRMIEFYGIPLKRDAGARSIRHPKWSFLRTGFGECFDSFFAYGLFALAERSGFFPAELVEVFEPVVQEEARHNLFFVNWLAYERRQRSIPSRAVLSVEAMSALGVQVWKRVGTAKSVDGDNFTRNGGESLGLAVSPRRVLELCLAEHERRMACYDERLLRPRLMPAVARLALRLLR